MLRFINFSLKPLNLILVPRTSAKMLTETANVIEVTRPGTTVRWLREVAELLHKGGDEYK